MGRKRRDQIAKDDVLVRERRGGRGRKLAVLVALAGAATYLVRRNQRKAELDEGIWHEAPSPAPTPPSAVPTS
ncbi:MAG TPA: hypothetical protein VJB61_20920 [Actinomycetota bacterium]|jgi:hypothetical protein